MDNKIVFIVPYYGKFPDYFREWCYSAGFLADENVDFLLITDIKIEFDLPRNIHVIEISFEQFKNRIQSKFDFNISLPSPYNICDYKPALGYVFSDEIKDYAFWGNCDIDQVWGSIRRFITNEILDNYDRINFLGHMILYRNNDQINEAFKLDGAIYNYRKVYSSPMHYSFCEHSGMMRIFIKNGLSNYICNDYADLSPRYTRAWVSRHKNYDKQIIMWKNGHVYRKYISDNGKVETDEFMYFHFQQKHPQSIIAKGFENPDTLLYHSDTFVLFENEQIIDADFINKNCDYISSETDHAENKLYKRRKVKAFIKAPISKKVLWIKQRIATKQVISNQEYFGRNYSNI